MSITLACAWNTARGHVSNGLRTAGRNVGTFARRAWSAARTALAWPAAPAGQPDPEPPAPQEAPPPRTTPRIGPAHPGRSRWEREVKAAAWRSSEVQVTALRLAAQMRADGTLEWRRDTLARRLGMPVRTLDRHLSSMSSDGWLEHELRGGNGRPAIYSASLPVVVDVSAPHDNDLRAHPVVRDLMPVMPEVARQVVCQDLKSCLPPTGAQLSPSCLPPDGALHIESAKHHAVDRSRGRRAAHPGSRGARTAPRRTASPKPVISGPAA